MPPLSRVSFLLAVVLALAVRFFAAASVAAAAGVAAGAEPAWVALRPDGARFAVSLPAAPERRVSSRLTPGGRVRTEEYAVVWGAAELRVEAHELPTLAHWMLSDEGILDRSAGDLLDAEGATDARSVAARRGDHLARHLTYTDARGRRTEALFVLVGDRLTLLVMSWPPGAPEAAGGERFFGSLEVW